MSDLEERAQWILSESGLHTFQVDAMLEEVEQALAIADDKLLRVRKGVADLPMTSETLRALRKAEGAAVRLRELQAKLQKKQERLVADAQSWWSGFMNQVYRWS